MYRQVLELDSGNIAAKTGEQSVLQRLVLEVEGLIASQSLEEAEQQLETLNVLWPGEERLRSLEDRITQSRQRIRELELAAAGAAEQQEITRQLQAATSALIAGQYLKPPDASAFHYFKKVLAREPDNQSAQRGLVQIADALIVHIQTATSANDFSRAETLLNDLRTVDPQHARLQATADDIASAKATFLQRQIENERLAKLQLQIDRLAKRNTQWLIGTGALEEQSDAGAALVDDINRLLKENPENSQLRTLYSAANERLDELLAAIAARELQDKTVEQKEEPSRRPIIGGF